MFVRVICLYVWYVCACEMFVRAVMKAAGPPGYIRLRVIPYTLDWYEIQVSLYWLLANFSVPVALSSCLMMPIFLWASLIVRKTFVSVCTTVKVWFSILNFNFTRNLLMIFSPALRTLEATNRFWSTRYKVNLPSVQIRHSGELTLTVHSRVSIRYV